MMSFKLNGAKKRNENFEEILLKSKLSICLLLWFTLEKNKPNQKKIKNKKTKPREIQQIPPQFILYTAMAYIFWICWNQVLCYCVKRWKGGRKLMNIPLLDDETDQRLETSYPLCEYYPRAQPFQYLHPLLISEWLLLTLGLQSLLVAHLLAQCHMPSGRTLAALPRVGSSSGSLWCRSPVHFSWDQWNTEEKKKKKKIADKMPCRKIMSPNKKPHWQGAVSRRRKTVKQKSKQTSLSKSI